MKVNYDTILKRIKPSVEEKQQLNDQITTLCSELKQEAQHIGEQIEVSPGGSTAKGTFLTGDFDIDIFVRFKQSTTDLSAKLESMLKPISKQYGFTIERVHGSRDYFTFTHENYVFEIVPVKYVQQKEDAQNITDMSPLHVKWVAKRTTKELQDDIRLAKQFFKANGLYGAESYIKGFSGHVLDILIIYYQGFNSFLKGISEWKEKTIIDMHDSENPLENLSRAKKESPLILIDPIDSSRNAAAALSKEKYELCKQQVKAFLSQPQEKFFDIPQFSKENVIKRTTKESISFIVRITPLEGKKDVVGAQILKIFNYLKAELKRNDFKIEHDEWWFDQKETIISLTTKNETLSQYVYRQGPPTQKKEDVERFKNVHTSTTIKDDRYYAKVKRKYLKPEECIVKTLENTYSKERMKTYQLETITPKHNKS
ncbi:MAG: CCA tRNA nucleotidyltransferase [Nanobdellota archaeon]